MLDPVNSRTLALMNAGFVMTGELAGQYLFIYQIKYLNKLLNFS